MEDNFQDIQRVYNLDSNILLDEDRLSILQVYIYTIISSNKLPIIVNKKIITRKYLQTVYLIISVNKYRNNPQDLIKFSKEFVEYIKDLPLNQQIKMYNDIKPIFKKINSINSKDIQDKITIRLRVEFLKYLKNNYIDCNLNKITSLLTIESFINCVKCITQIYYLEKSLRLPIKNKDEFNKIIIETSQIFLNKNEQFKKSFSKINNLILMITKQNFNKTEILNQIHIDFEYCDEDNNLKKIYYDFFKILLINKLELENYSLNVITEIKNKLNNSFNCIMIKRVEDIDLIILSYFNQYYNNILCKTNVEFLDLHIEKLSNNKEVILVSSSSMLQNTIKNCVKNKQIFITPISINKNHFGHMNAIIYLPEHNKIEYYEPHSFNCDKCILHNTTNPIEINDNIKSFFEDLNLLYESSIELKLEGLQNCIEFSEFKIYNRCILLTYFILNERIKNRSKTMKEFIYYLNSLIYDYNNSKDYTISTLYKLIIKFANNVWKFSNEIN